MSLDLWPRIQLAFWAVSTHTNGSCWASHPSTPPNTSPQCFSQSFLHPACTCTWDCPGPGAFGHVALDEVHTGTPLKPLEVPLDSIPPSNVLTAPHSLCHWQTCWRRTQFYFPCHWDRVRCFAQMLIMDMCKILSCSSLHDLKNLCENILLMTLLIMHIKPTHCFETCF